MSRTRVVWMSLAVLIGQGWIGAPASARRPDAAPAQEPQGPRERARALVAALSEERFEDATRDFDERMRGALPAKRLAEVWQTLRAQAGRLERIEGDRIEDAPPYRVVVVQASFEKAPLDIRVTVDAENRVAGLFFTPKATPAPPSPAPPSPAPPYADTTAFDERAVEVGTGEWALPGTLSLPRSGAPCSAVVLVHGSGPNDRDETLGPNKPFRDIAWGLASRGIAVLRYEKRTRAHSGKLAGRLADFTVQEETVDDALAAVALLRRMREIDPRRVFALGHSLGGTLLPRIGARDAAIAGFIILAGATRPLEDAILDQVRHLAQIDGEISAGEREGLVTLEDFEGWKTALGEGSEARFRLYPQLNHLFMPGEGPLTASEYERPGHVDRAVIEEIAGWIETIR